MSLWTRFTSWLSGWPEGAPRKGHRSDKAEDMLFREQEILAEEQTPEKKPKGLNPKKKKKKKDHAD
jgi:hypothetical protein